MMPSYWERWPDDDKEPSTADYIFSVARLVLIAGFALWLWFYGIQGFK